MAKVKTMVNRPDYRKTDKSVFGIVKFKPTQKADDRFSEFYQFLWNTVYFCQDIISRITWMNLNQVEQRFFKDRK